MNRRSLLKNLFAAGAVLNATPLIGSSDKLTPQGGEVVAPKGAIAFNFPATALYDPRPVLVMGYRRVIKLDWPVDA